MPTETEEQKVKRRFITFENVVIIKISLTCGLLAAYVVPPPYNIVVGAAANMIWLWKKL